jgi:tetratricopeptide (TPR) repeat protein
MMDRRIRIAAWKIASGLLSAALGCFLHTAPAAAQTSVLETGIELTAPVRQQLRQLHGSWQSWTRAYYQGDREAADAAAEQLRSISGHLGLKRLPDLALSTAAFAVLSARDGDFERAEWILETSRKLDDERPEVDFATAMVQRLQGDWVGASVSAVKGTVQLLWLPLERSIWLHNVALRFFLVLVVSGGLFVALQLGLRYPALHGDLLALVPRSVPRPVAEVVVIAALVWPLALPSGVLWLALCWSVLVWGYGSLSEKAVFILLWLLLGVAPLGLSYQQRSMQLALIPPSRALDNLAAGRLYGALFTDLGVLRALNSDSPAVLEMAADLHRRFGQWEYARPLYNILVHELGQAGGQTAAPLNNIGLFHLRNKDNGTAVGYFQRATEADPGSAESFYNLSQAYSQMFEFGRSNAALERANGLDREAVERWNDPESGRGAEGVAVDGGLRRVDEIRAELRTAATSGEGKVGLLDLWRRHLSLTIAAVLIALAVTFRVARRQLGTPSELAGDPALPGAADNRWARALVPGLASLAEGHGVRAFVGIALPVALLILVAAGGFGYRPPLGFDVGPLPSQLGLAALILLFAARMVPAFRGDRR